MSKNEENTQNNNLTEALAKIACLTAPSFAMAAIISPIGFTMANLGKQKVDGNAYLDTLANVKKLPAKDIIEGSGKNFMRRAVAFLPINIAGQVVKNDYQLGSFEISAASAILETALGSKKEMEERFIDKYSKEIAGSPKNRLYGTSAILARNFTKSGASCMIGPVVADFCEEKDIKNPAIIGSLDLGLALLLATASVPLDTVVTRLSSGKETADEVLKGFSKSMKSGNVNQMFRGGFSRVGAAVLFGYSHRLAIEAGKYFYEHKDKDHKYNNQYLALEKEMDYFRSNGFIKFSEHINNLDIIDFFSKSAVSIKEEDKINSALLPETKQQSLEEPGDHDFKKQDQGSVSNKLLPRVTVSSPRIMISRGFAASHLDAGILR